MQCKTKVAHCTNPSATQGLPKIPQQKSMTKKTMLLCGAALLPFVAIARDYQGQILAENSQTPLQGVHILNERGQLLAQSNHEGKFRITLNEQQNHKLRFQAEGYETLWLTIRPQSKQEFVVQLHENTQTLSDIVVTTTRTERSIKDEPVVTHVFTARQIERLAAPSFQDVLTSLIPGVQFENQRNGSGTTQSIRLQGMGGSYIMFLLDGEPISAKNGENFLNRRGGQIDFSRIDLNNIERIEYLPSGGSILYGSNSIGGVVNIISKRNTRPLQLQVASRFTFPQQQRYELSGGTANSQANVRANISLTNNNSYTAYTNEKGEAVTLPGSKLLTAATNTNWQATPNLRLRLGGNFANTRLLSERESGNLKTQAYITQSGGTKAGGQWQISPRQMLDVSGSFDLAKREVEVWDKSKQEKFVQADYNNEVVVARLQYNHTHSQQHTSIIGGENTFEHLRTQWLERKDKGENQNTAVLYAQHDANFFDRKFFVSYGLRYDHNSTFGGYFLQRLSLMQKIGAIDLRLLYSESFRSPTLTERFARVEDPSGRFVYMGNPDLSPEKSRRYTLQAGYSSQTFNISASAYRADVSNLIENQRFENPSEPSGFMLKGVNTDQKVSILGSELLLRGQFTNGIYGQASYSLTKSISRTVTDIKGKAYNTSLVRPHSLSALVGYSFVWGATSIDCNLSARYTAKVSYWRAKPNNDTQKYPHEIKVRDARGTDGFLTYYNVVEDAYSNVRLTTAFKYRKAYTLQLGIDNLLGFQANSTNFTSALTNGRQFMLSFVVNLDKIKF